MRSLTVRYWSEDAERATWMGTVRAWAGGAGGAFARVSLIPWLPCSARAARRCARCGRGSVPATAPGRTSGLPARLRAPRQRRQRIRGSRPRGERAVQPLGVVAPRMVLTEMRSPALGAHKGAVGDAQRDLQHPGQTIRCDELRIGAGLRRGEADVAALPQQPLKLFDRLRKLFAGAEDADLGGHDLLHPCPKRVGILPTAPTEERIDGGLLTLDKLVDQPGGDLQIALGTRAEVRNELADDHSRDDRL